MKEWLANPTGIRNLTLTSFQGLNSKIYMVQNDRNYNAADMVSRIHRYCTQVLKAVRKGQTELVDFWLCMGFSWSLALANRLHIDLESEMWCRFPGVCPYCNSVPCVCKERAAERVATPAIMGVHPASLSEFQKMFARIYPHNTLQDAAMHLAEEVGETSEALEFFMGTHKQDLFKEIVVELVDMITNMFAVATALKLDLAVEMEKHFSDGCPRCHQVPCGCGFTIAKSVTI